MNTDTDFNQLVVNHPDSSGSPARPCFEICLFYDTARSKLKSGLCQALLQFIQQYPGRFRWFKTNTMQHAAAIRDDAQTLVQSLLLSPEFEKPGDIGIELHSGSHARDHGTPSLKLFSEERAAPKSDSVRRTFVRLCLPVPSTGTPQDLFALATQCTMAQPPYCGHAGYSWYWNSGDTIMERELGKRKGLLLNHPAMGYSDPFTFFVFIGTGLIQVGWLTFVGPSLLQRLGGDLPRATLAQNVGLTDLGQGQGVVLTAGPQPIVGSRAPRDAAALQPYREVGQLLSRVRLPDTALEFMDIAGFDDEIELREWYCRFFGETDS